MLKTKKSLEVLLLISIVLTSALAIFHEVPIVKANVVEDAIDLGLDWLDRMAYLEINNTHAVGLESPSLDFRIKRSDGYWTIALKKDNLNLPSSATMITGGCLAPEATTDDLGLISGEIDNQRMKYRFDIDEDGDYNDTVLYVEYATMNDTMTRTAGKIVEYHNKGITQSLQLEKTQVIATISLNAQFTIDKDGGWAGTRYTIRPTTKGLADLYVWLGTTEFSWLGGQTYQETRGVDYLDRALKLYRTWYGSGYILDRFDGMYGATYTVRPWAGEYGIPNYPVNPDLVLQPWYGISGDIDAYIDNNNKTAGWYNYNNLPDSVTFRNQHQIAVYNTVSRMVMPDDTEWDKCPFLCSDDEFCFAYRSRTGFNYARNQYLANGFEYDLLNYCDLPLVAPGLDVLLGIGTDAKSIRACGDMYKYGANIPYGLNTLKTEFIDSAQWDGNGIPQDSWHGSVIGWPYPAYGTHNTATYGNALVQYYKLTSDSSVGARADEAIGVLLMLQNKIGLERYSRSRDTSMYRAEFAGSFLPGYAVAYSFGQQDIYSASWTDTIYNTLQYLGIFEQDPASTSYPCMGNAECTIPSVWTLIQYRTTGRTPDYPAQQYDYTLPFQSNVVATTDHGGSYSGDGLTEIVSSNLQSTYIGGQTGNVYQHTGKLDRVRLASNGGLGNGWASIEYQWSFTLSNPATNWRTKVYFTIPDFYGYNAGGNSLTVTASLYNSGQQLVEQETRTPISDISASTFNNPLNAKMFFYDSFAKVDSLAAGSYTVKLKFKIDSGALSRLNIGYTGAYVESTALPMGLEYFGYDMEEAQNPLTYQTLTVQSSIGGYANWTIGQHHFLKNQKVTLDNIPDVGYEFYYWEIDGQPSGGQDVRELYMDTDHTIKPIFDEVQYYLAIARPYWASIYPDGGYFDPGIHVYPYASSNDPSMQFAYWTVDDDPTPVYDNPIHVYMDSDHNLMTYWEPRTPYLEIIKPAFGTTNYESGYYTYQQQLSVSAGSTDSNWAFDYWLVDGGYVQQHVNPYIITMDDDHTLDARYKPKLTVQLMNGYIYTDPSAGELTGYYELGTEIEIEGYTTNPSWRFWKFKLDGVTHYENPITVRMDEPHTLQVYAEENTFDLTVSYDENHGDCNPSEGTYEKLYNTLVEIWAYPDAGYKVHAWVIDGVEHHTDSTYWDFYMPEEDVTIEVQWEQIQTRNVGFYAWFDQTLATVGIKIDGQSGYSTNHAYALEYGWHTITYYAQFYQWYYDQAGWSHDGTVTYFQNNEFDIYVDANCGSVTAYYHD